MGTRVRRQIIKDVYNENYQNNSIHVNSIEAQKIEQDNFFCLFETVNESDKEDELEEYLRKPAVNFRTDPLQWWKVSKLNS